MAWPVVASLAPMAWLLCEGRVLASLEVATSRRDRRTGLLGRDTVEGALLVERCRWVHTIGMRFAIDAAYLDPQGAVLKTVRMAPNRIGVPMLKADRVIEAQAGAFARWGLHVGDLVEVRTA